MPRRSMRGELKNRVVLDAAGHDGLVDAGLVAEFDQAAELAELDPVHGCRLRGQLGRGDAADADGGDGNLPVARGLGQQEGEFALPRDEADMLKLKGGLG